MCGRCGGLSAGVDGGRSVGGDGLVTGRNGEG